jgi:hypothetical protein
MSSIFSRPILGAVGRGGLRRGYVIVRVSRPIEKGLARNSNILFQKLSPRHRTKHVRSPPVHPIRLIHGASRLIAVVRNASPTTTADMCPLVGDPLCLLNSCTCVNVLKCLTCRNDSDEYCSYHHAKHQQEYANLPHSQ